MRADLSDINSFAFTASSALVLNKVTALIMGRLRGYRTWKLDYFRQGLRRISRTESQTLPRNGGECKNKLEVNVKEEREKDNYSSDICQIVNYSVNICLTRKFCSL